MNRWRNGKLWLNTLKRNSVSLKFSSLVIGVLSTLYRQFSPSGYSFAPMVVKLGVNSLCNAKCKTCDIGTHNRDTTFYRNMNVEDQVLDFNLAAKVVDEVATYRPKIVIDSTEPLLYKPIFELIRHIKNRKMECHIQTNGLDLERFSGEIVDSGLDSLGVSIDGTASVHDSVRGIPQMYNRIFSGLEKIQQQKAKSRLKEPYLIINYVISEHSQEVMVDFVKDLIDRGILIKTLNFYHQSFISKTNATAHNKMWGNVLPVTQSNCYEADPELIDWHQMAQTISEVNNISTPFNINWIPQLEEEESIKSYYLDHLSPVGKRACVVPWHIVSVKPDGSVNIIHRCFDLSLGNVQEQPLMDIFNGPPIREFRQLMRTQKVLPACERCCGLY
jgi:Fe-coproporphyrin III synthase